MDPGKVIETASAMARPFIPSEDCASGSVAAALITEAGKVHTGVSIDCRCGLGFCAEHSAIAEMLKHGEAHISMIVAVNSGGVIMPPCGRCRELMWQVSPRNADAEVILGVDRSAPLSDLLPER
jgi:cytidine deaminase